MARLWDVASAQELKRFDGHLSLVAAVAFHPNGKQIATGSVDQLVRLAAATEEHSSLVAAQRAQTRKWRPVVRPTRSARCIHQAQLIQYSGAS
jgi:predicted NACHT family NTPase